MTQEGIVIVIDYTGTANISLKVSLLLYKQPIITTKCIA